MSGSTRLDAGRAGELERCKLHGDQRHRLIEVTDGATVIALVRALMLDRHARPPCSTAMRGVEHFDDFAEGASLRSINSHARLLSSMASIRAEVCCSARLVGWSCMR